MIRKIKSQDKTEYIKMTKDFYSSPAVLSSVPESHFEATFDEIMQGSAYAEAFIFECNNEIAGYGLVAKTFSQEAGGMVIWIEEIYIKSTFRNQGLGSEFIKYVKENMPAKRYRLETEPNNFKAQQLYKRHGFEHLEYINYSLEEKT